MRRCSGRRRREPTAPGGTRPGVRRWPPEWSGAAAGSRALHGGRARVPGGRRVRECDIRTRAFLARVATVTACERRNKVAGGRSGADRACWAPAVVETTVATRPGPPFGGRAQLPAEVSRG